MSKVHLHPFNSLRTTGGTAEVSYVCSQPSCQPTELQSSFHSSKLQPSFHSSPFQPSFQEVPMVHFCADSCVSELVSDSSFQDVRTSFRCFALVQAFGTLVRTFGSFGFPLIFLLEFGIGPRPCACVLDKRADDLDIAEEPAHMELEHSAPLFLQQMMIVGPQTPKSTDGATSLLRKVSTPVN